MPFFGPLKLSEANAPSTNALPGQQGYTAYPAGQQFRIGGQSPGQDYIGLIAQELGKRFPGMSGLTSYPGQGGGGTSALGFSFNNPQPEGTLEGIGGVTPESLTALLSGAGAPQTIEELITRVSPSVRGSGAGQATAPSQAGQSSLAPTGTSEIPLNFGGESVGEGGGGQIGDPSGNTPGMTEGFGGFGPGMNSTAAGITGGILGGALGMGGGILGMGAGALSGFNAGQQLAEAVNARGELGLISTLGMNRGTGAMDDPSAQEGALGVAPGGDVGPASATPSGQETGVTGGVSAPGGLGPGPGEAGGISGGSPGGPSGNAAGDTGGQAGEADTGGGPGAAADAGTEGGQAGGETGGGEGGGGGAGGGDKIICNHLYACGYLDQATWEADEYFGKTLPRTVYDGYTSWAERVVKIMKRFPRTVPLVAAIARPWTEEMAYQMGSRGRGSIIGKIMMKIGWVICDRIGKRLQARESVSSV